MRQRQLYLYSLLFMLMVSVSMWGRVWSADDIPMIHLEDASQYVCDPDGIMEQAWRDSANYYLQRLDRDCGIESIFIIVNQIKGGDAFRMTQDVGNKYGAGNRDTNRGLVVVIAVEDRRYFIAPGKGLEADLTDVECDDIGRACIVANMKYGKPDLAVAETAKAIYNKFYTGKTGIASIDNADEWTVGDTIVLLLLILFFFGVPILLFISWVLGLFGIKWPKNQDWMNGGNRHDNHFPPFIFTGGGSGGRDHWGGGGFSGGSFGGGSFGGGGAGGGW